MMNKYEIRVIPNQDNDGDTYWTAFFPAIEGCVGGGSTAEEAIKEANENLEVFLEYLLSEHRELPKEYEEHIGSGKIALRIPKTVHQKLIELADDEGVSLNTIINNAVSNYIGKSEYDYEIRQKIEALQDIAEKSYILQVANAMYQNGDKSIWERVSNMKIGVKYE